MPATRLPAEATVDSSDRVSGAPSWVRIPTALDGACSVFDILCAEDILMMVDAMDLQPYEVVAAQSWQHVGDSMREVLDSCSSARRA